MTVGEKKHGEKIPCRVGGIQVDKYAGILDGVVVFVIIDRDVGRGIGIARGYHSGCVCDDGGEHKIESLFPVLPAMNVPQRNRLHPHIPRRRGHGIAVALWRLHEGVGWLDDDGRSLDVQRRAAGGEQEGEEVEVAH